MGGLPPKNFSDSCDSIKVVWSSMLSPSFAGSVGQPNLGSQPVLPQSSSSSSSIWPFARGFPFWSLTTSIAPALEGVGRSTSAFVPSSISVTIATPLGLRWKPSGIACPQLAPATQGSGNARARGLQHTALAWALFSSGLASGSKVNAVTPASLLSSTILRSASAAETLLSGSREASMAPCCLSSLAACAVAILRRASAESTAALLLPSQLVQSQCQQALGSVCWRQQLGRAGAVLGGGRNRPGSGPLDLRLRGTAHRGAPDQIDREAGTREGRGEGRWGGGSSRLSREKCRSDAGVGPPKNEEFSEKKGKGEKQSHSKMNCSRRTEQPRVLLGMSAVLA